MAERLALKGLFVTGMLAGSVLVGTSVAAMAQDASGDCSGFMCKVFGSTIKDAPAPAPAAAQPVAAAPDVADPADPPEKGAARRAAAKPAKPMPTVTIAADGAEAVRLKALAATLPKTRVHIVPAIESAKADFAVAPAVDGASPAEKARLFTEELHIVAGPGVQVPADLADKVVSFGPDKGPAQAAARKAFAALGVTVKETPLDLDNALDGVATGDVAAVVVLAPQPDARLARLKTTSGLHLVGWPEGAAVPEGATVATIPGQAYPGLAKPGDRVRAIGVEAALDATGKAAANPAAKAFLVALSQHSASLARHGFDLIKADLETRNGRRVASAGR